MISRDMWSFFKRIKHFYTIFPDYETALKYCNPKGYEADEIIEVVFQKTLNFKQNLEKNSQNIIPSIANTFCAILPKIVEKDGQEIKIIDFGGACGALYFQVRNFLPKKQKFRWAVVETPAMVKKAKSLENDELSFYVSLEDAVKYLEKVDILHTSGTLQAVHKPREYLQKLLNIHADYMFFNRVGVNQGEKDVYTIHKSKLSWNGPGNLPDGFQDKWIKYPFSFISESFFLQTIQNQYDIIAKFEDNTGMYPVLGYSIVGYALLCKLKNET